MSNEKGSAKDIDERKGDDASELDDELDEVDLEGAVGGSITQTVTRAIETGRSGTARARDDGDEFDLNNLGS